MQVDLLFDTPGLEIWSNLCDGIRRAKSFQVVVGFLTEEGVKLLSDAIATNPNAIASIIVGAATFKAFSGLEHLATLGIPLDRLRVHLGFSREGGKDGFIKYHPMMHSKIYYWEYPNGDCEALVGSHNLTSYALAGRNVEASIQIRGKSSDAIFISIRRHLESVRGDSLPYDPTMRLAYAWWNRQFIDGLGSKVLYGDGDEGIERVRNVVAIGVMLEDEHPRPGDIIYLEIPRQFQTMKALDEEVHFYILPQKVTSPSDAMLQLPSCGIAFRGSVVGSNIVVVESGKADWRIRDLRNPVLERTTGLVTLNQQHHDLQVFIKIEAPLYGRYEYIFHPKTKWTPVYDQQEPIELRQDLRSILSEMDSIPPEHLPWKRVIGLEPVGMTEEARADRANVVPGHGRYVVLSLRRRPLFH